MRHSQNLLGDVNLELQFEKEEVQRTARCVVARITQQRRNETRIHTARGEGRGAPACVCERGDRSRGTGYRVVARCGRCGGRGGWGVGGLGGLQARQRAHDLGGGEHADVRVGLQEPARRHRHVGRAHPARHRRQRRSARRAARAARAACATRATRTTSQRGDDRAGEGGGAGRGGRGRLRGRRVGRRGHDRRLALAGLPFAGSLSRRKLLTPCRTWAYYSVPLTPSAA